MVNTRERKQIKISHLEELRTQYHLGKYTYDEMVFQLSKDCVTVMQEVPWMQLQYSMSQKACAARSLFCYIVYTHTKLSYGELAKRINKSKGSIHQMVRRMQFYVETPKIYPEFKQVVELTTSMIERHLRQPEEKNE